MIATADPTVWAEELRPGYARYRNKDGRRWEVHGICDRRGDCMIGAVLPDGTVIESVDQILESVLDVPVTPEFAGCCPFTFVEL